MPQTFQSHTDFLQVRTRLSRLRHKRTLQIDAPSPLIQLAAKPLESKYEPWSQWNLWLETGDGRQHPSRDWWNSRRLQLHYHQMHTLLSDLRNKAYQNTQLEVWKRKCKKWLAPEVTRHTHYGLSKTHRVIFTQRINLKIRQASQHQSRWRALSTYQPNAQLTDSFTFVEKLCTRSRALGLGVEDQKFWTRAVEHSSNPRLPGSWALCILRFKSKVEGTKVSCFAGLRFEEF